MKVNQPRCYIDSCVIIDYVKGRCDVGIEEDRVDELAYVEKILNASRASAIKLFSSTLATIECWHVGNKTNIPDEAIKYYKEIFDTAEVITPISLNPFIALKTRSMLWNGFPSPGKADQIHIASAIHTNCSEIITFDRFGDSNSVIELLCNQYNISVVYPSESVVSKNIYFSYFKEKRKKEDEEAKELLKGKRLSLI